MFEEIDKNKDGNIDWAEFQAQTLEGSDPEQLRAEWESFDPVNGFVDLQRYTQSLLAKFDFKAAAITANAQDQWDCYQKTPCQNVEIKSFIEVQQARADPAPTEMLVQIFKAIDSNGDGKISFNEYLEAMLQEQLC